MHKHTLFIRRCFELARRGAGYTSPNPSVGAVLVHGGRVLSEGYHRAYGGPHAEVMAIRNLKDEDRSLLPFSTLYVSLEPCCITGRTPPCTNLILEHKIPRVVISCLDQTPGVNGRGVKLLEEAGVEVISHVLEAEGLELSAHRQTYVSQLRPYVVLKYACSADGFIGKQGEQIWLSTAFSRRLVHRWRSELGAILVGTNTAWVDDPALTTRYFPGKSPLRIVLDRNLRLPSSSKLFDGESLCWVITEKESPATIGPNLEYKQLVFDEQLLPSLLQMLHVKGINSLMVEGGATLLNSFIEQKLWDEARVLNSSVYLGNGIPAPSIPTEPKKIGAIGSDTVYRFLANGT